jgi:hypothetical protein
VYVQGTTITMHFEDWTSRKLDKWKIYDIWIRVFGCLDTLGRDFLGLLDVGSLVGKIKEVDMKFTWSMGLLVCALAVPIHILFQDIWTTSMMVKVLVLSSCGGSRWVSGARWFC